MHDAIRLERGQWPKRIPPLTPEQQVISDDFMHYWHEVLPQKYGLIEKFNHTFPLRGLRAEGRARSLEIGAGRGAHLAFEDLSRQDYYTVELRANMAESLTERFPNVTSIVGDCQQRLPFDDGFFDRVMAIHVLEHLPMLPDAIAEVARVLKPDGVFAIVIPCDPGLAYGVARRISAQRIFEQRYRQPYRWFISREHINSPAEITSVLEEQFVVQERSYFPLIVPVKDLNLCIGMLAKKKAPST